LEKLLDLIEDLQRIYYSPLYRIPGELKPLGKWFEGHVKQAELAAISKLVGQGGANINTRHELLAP